MDAVDKKFIRIIRGNVRQVVYPTKIVKRIVNEIDSDAITIVEAAEKYEVLRVTIINWLKKYSSRSEDQYIKKKWPKELKRQAVSHIEQGFISKKEAAKKYNIDLSTISVWIKSYSCKVIINKQDMHETIKNDDRERDHIQEENGELKLTVDKLKLKVVALETMIDVAEKELKIEIRKKSGTKQ